MHPNDLAFVATYIGVFIMGFATAIHIGRAKPTPVDNSPLREGDIVRLKHGGGSTMVIAEIIGKKCTCQWVYCDFQEKVFPLSVLMRAAPNK